MKKNRCIVYDEWGAVIEHEVIEEDEEREQIEQTR